MNHATLGILAVGRRAQLTHSAGRRTAACGLSLLPRHVAADCCDGVAQFCRVMAAIYAITRHLSESLVMRHRLYSLHGFTRCTCNEHARQRCVTRFAPRLALVCVAGEAQAVLELLRATKVLAKLPVSLRGFRRETQPITAIHVSSRVHLSVMVNASQRRDSRSGPIPGRSESVL